MEDGVTKSKVCCHDSKWPLDQTVKFSATMDAPSDQVDDNKVRIENVGQRLQILGFVGFLLDLQMDFLNKIAINKAT